VTLQSLGPVVQSFFLDCLVTMKGLRPSSVRSYRDGIKLFLRFVADAAHRRITQLTFADLTFARVLDFLRHLEEVRHNHPRTRNQRLALMHTFFEYLAVRAPIESAAIDLLGLDLLANRVAGHGAARCTVDDVNARYGARPVAFADDDRIILIRIARRFRTSMPNPELYEVTRKWRIGAKRRQLGSPGAPDFALAVHEGVVLAAFRIQAWLPATEADFAEDTKRRGRWCFEGTRDRRTRRPLALRCLQIQSGVGCRMGGRSVVGRWSVVS
jgi:hypothetical protein